MTAKDFRLIAETIYNLHIPADERRVVTVEFADSLARTNARFDRDRFIAACLGKDSE